MRALPFRYAEGRFRGPDGLMLFERRWEPQQRRATIALVHGLNDHSGRYEALGRRLAAEGYAVGVFDLRGHGRSEGRRLWVDHFEEYLEDLDTFLERFAAPPVFLLGHSLGGAVAALYEIEGRPRLGGLVLTSPALGVGRNLPPALIRLSPLLDRLVPQAPVVTLGIKGISRDPQVLREAMQDPLKRRLPPPVHTGVQTLWAMRRIEEGAEEITDPLLIMHGTGDRLTDWRTSQRFYESVSSPDKTLKLYEDFYHELFNEPGSERVFGDLFGWLAARSGAQGAEGG